MLRFAVLPRLPRTPQAPLLGRLREPLNPLGFSPAIMFQTWRWKSCRCCSNRNPDSSDTFGNAYGSDTFDKSNSSDNLENTDGFDDCHQTMPVSGAKAGAGVHRSMQDVPEMVIMVI